MALRLIVDSLPLRCASAGNDKWARSGIPHVAGFSDRAAMA